MIFTSNCIIQIIFLCSLLWDLYFFFLISTQISNLSKSCSGSEYFLSVFSFCWEYWRLVGGNNAMSGFITGNRFFPEQSHESLAMSMIKSFPIPCSCNCKRVEPFTIFCSAWLNLHVLYDLILLKARWSRYCYPCCQMRKQNSGIYELPNPQSHNDHMTAVTFELLLLVFFLVFYKVMGIVGNSTTLGNP